MTAANIHVQRITLDVNSRPDKFTRSRDATKRTPAAWEIHDRLAKSLGSGPAVNKMSWWGGATDHEHPNVIAHGSRSINVSPTYVVKRTFNRLLRCLLD